MERHERKAGLAARAAWLYYVGKNTQDEIAIKLNVSRQAAQRLVSLADSEGLIRHRLAHPLTECIELAEELRSKYDLFCCDVAPSDPASGDSLAALGACGAACLEGYLATKTPTIIALSAGRALRATVSQVAPMNQPQHKIVSLQGHMGQDGRASHFEVVMNLADRINAQAYLLSTPVVARTVEERALLQQQHAFQAVRELVKQTRVAFVGIGEMVWNGPLQQDGFYNDADVTELLERGAVGSILAWAYDREGRLIPSTVNDRVAGMPLDVVPPGRMVGVAKGSNKVEATLAALRGRLVAGLITDEATARLILAG